MRSSLNQEDVLPIGVAVDPSPAKAVKPATLRGDRVTLAPIDVDAHAEALYRNSHGPRREQLWHYMSEGPFSDYGSFRDSLAAKSKSTDRVFFVIVDNASGGAVGYAALMRIDPSHRTIEVGHVLFTSLLQKTTGATEAMYLLARHIFEDLGYRRYEWKCNALNTPSRRAALRFGFAFEGVFRQHMIIKGRNRDTAWFSMLDTDWPARKRAFECWLDPANFDETGNQKRALADIAV